MFIDVEHSRPCQVIGYSHSFSYGCFLVPRVLETHIRVTTPLIRSFDYGSYEIYNTAQVPDTMACSGSCRTVPGHHLHGSADGHLDEQIAVSATWGILVSATWGILQTGVIEFLYRAFGGCYKAGLELILVVSIWLFSWIGPFPWVSL